MGIIAWLCDAAQFLQHAETTFPPKRPRWKVGLLVVIWAAIIVGGLVIADQFFHLLGLPSNIAFVYLGSIVLLSLVALDRCIRHRIIAHKERQEDPSEVHALLDEARDVEPRQMDPTRPENFEERKSALLHGLEELERLGEYGWTEKRILPLQIMLVDFYAIDDLRAQAQSILNELQEYAEDSSYRYDREYFAKWDERVKSASQKIDKSRTDHDLAAEGLRAEVRTLLAHVADYKAFWTEGSMIIRGIMVGGAMAIPLFLLMGLAPALHPDGSGVLGILNWGLLGIVGALTAVVLGLRKSDLVEVGNTEGKRELWRAVLGGVLGLVAGIIVYTIFGAGLITEGRIVPNVSPDAEAPRDVALAVLWAIAAGISLERVFERVRGMSDVAG